MKDITKLGENIEVKKPVFDAKERAEIAAKFNLGKIVRSLGGDTVDAGYEAEIGKEAIHRETEGRRTPPRTADSMCPTSSSEASAQ